ncbi:MAG: hypothetical protein IKS07_11495 [Lachnospiraceae bacterium]|nr:hypothetical protein [Lachnospiraceae bacterium]
MTKSEIVSAVRDFLDSDDWNYDYNDERCFIKCGVNLKCKLQSIQLYVNFNDNGYSVYAICKLNADTEVRNTVNEYLARANYGLRNGNFEMDFSDGEVRYKCYVNTKGLDVIPTEIIDDSISIPCAMFDRYGNGLAAILMGFSDPATEIEKAEEDTR